MKYKIGTMVKLSAAGHKRQHNPRRVRTGFGIILEYNTGLKFPYILQWFSEGQEGREFTAKEYELKRVIIQKSNKK